MMSYPGIQIRHRGLCKTLFKEVQSNGCPERRREGLQRPSVIREENPPGLQLGDSALYGRAQGTDLVVVLAFTHVQFTFLRLADRSSDVVGSYEPFVTDDAACLLEDPLAVRLFKLCHVMLIAGNRLGYESNAASESRDDKRPVACRL